MKKYLICLCCVVCQLSVNTLAAVKTERVSVSSQGVQHINVFNPHFDVSISADGRYTVFDSKADLVPTDGIDSGGLFLHDRVTGQTTPLGINAKGDGYIGGGDVVISADGRYVAYEVVTHIFVYDRVLGQVEQVDVPSQGGLVSGSSPSISADGRYIAFSSSSRNLVPEDTSATHDIFVRDRVLEQTIRVSVASDGSEANNSSSDPSISADGGFVALISGASNFASLDTNNQNDVFVSEIIRTKPINRFGDFNGDRRSDVVWRHALTGENRVFYMQGTRVNSDIHLSNLTDSNWIIAGITDFNKNKKDDILLRNIHTGQNWIYLMFGKKIAKSKSIRRLADTAWQVVGTGDFDGRGKGDILWRHAITGENRIFFMNGTKVVSNKRINFVRDSDWHVAGTGDFNGDRKADVMWRHSRSGANIVYIMRNNRIVTSKRINTVTDANWSVKGIDDFNKDRNDDILWRNSVTGVNLIYFMRGTKITRIKKINRVSDTHWQIAGTGDFNRDGKADVFWRNASTGVNLVYLMDGAKIVKSEKVNTIADPYWQVAGPH